MMSDIIGGNVPQKLTQNDRELAFSSQNAKI